MDGVKLFFFLFLNSLKTYLSDVWAETKQFFGALYGRVVGFFAGVIQAVGHLVSIPVHAAQWLWGCVTAAGRAIKRLW